MTRSTALFVAAIVAALTIGYLLRDTPGYAVRTADGAYEGDLTHYVYWTRLVTLGGIQAAYQGQWPETYAVYPPLTLYPYQLIGNVYRVVEDPTFDLERAQASLWLRAALKLVALSWHVLVGMAIYAFTRRQAGALPAALYVVNPAALYDVAHWAQPDGAHSVFSVLAIAWLVSGHMSAAWAAIALATLSKPQAWSLVPLLAVATVCRRGPRALAYGAAIGLLAGGVVIFPFLVTGRLGELLTLPGTVASVMPVISADAHNLWWLVAAARGLDPLLTADSARLLGPVTFRTAAAVLVLAQFGLACWLYWTGRVVLPEAAALTVLGWFVCTTQAHENHLFFVLPLLALAWVERRWLLGLYGVLSVTLLLNMTLHDQLVLEALGRSLNDGLIARLRLLNAAAIVLCFVTWCLVRITSHDEPFRESTDARQEPRSHSAGRRPELQHTT